MEPSIINKKFVPKKQTIETEKVILDFYPNGKVKAIMTMFGDQLHGI